MPTDSPADRTARAAAIARAEEVARAGGGAGRRHACRFVCLCEGAAALLPPSGPGAWVLVAVEASAEPGRAAHLRERARTAAQRFTLSLWAEGFAAVWVAGPLPDADGLRAAGLLLGAAEPFGAVWLPD